MKGVALEKILALQDAVHRIFEKQGEIYRDSVQQHGAVTPVARARYRQLDRLRTRLLLRMWRLVGDGLTERQKVAFDTAWDARQERQKRAFAARQRLRERKHASAA